MKKKVKRDRHEIIYQILRQCQNPVRITLLMRSVEGSYAQMKSFLKWLEENGLLIKKGVHWLTTEKGKEYLKIFEELKKLMEA